MSKLILTITCLAFASLTTLHAEGGCGGGGCDGKPKEKSKDNKEQTEKK